jgi:hypothetical protein
VASVFVRVLVLAALLVLMRVRVGYTALMRMLVRVLLHGSFGLRGLLSS